MEKDKQISPLDLNASEVCDLSPAIGPRCVMYKGDSQTFYYKAQLSVHSTCYLCMHDEV
jgi:hypothetical protein